MEPNNHYGLAIVLLIIGLVVGLGGGYYVAKTGIADQYVGQYVPQQAPAPAANTSVNPGSGSAPSTDVTSSTTVKVNPFQ